MECCWKKRQTAIGNSEKETAGRSLIPGSVPGSVRSDRPGRDGPRKRLFWRFSLGGCFLPRYESGQKILPGSRVELDYSRTKGNAGYYLRGEGEFNPSLAKQIRSAAAEVDPQQIQITRTLSPSERVQQGFSITHLAQQVTGYRQNIRKEAHA
ncbi:MAG: hypothetical protein R6U51_04480 [Anaerolineales bacterium]